MTKFGVAGLILACAFAAHGQRVGMAEDDVNASPFAPTIEAATAPTVVNSPVELANQNVYLGRQPPRPRFYHWNGPWGPGCYFAPRGFHHSYCRPVWPF